MSWPVHGGTSGPIGPSHILPPISITDTFKLLGLGPFSGPFLRAASGGSVLGFAPFLAPTSAHKWHAIVGNI